MTPRQYRLGGAGVPIAYASAKTPLGLLMIGATGRGLCFVQFGASESALRGQLAREYPNATLERRDVSRDTQFAAWMRALTAYLEDGRPRESLPVDVQGTAFQLRVWHYLRRIPAGTVQSYTEVAAGIGRPTAVRAVASACARNRVALVIPCHRVIRGDGGLGGFRWGLARKRTLIDRERGARAKARTA
jgi:AraC family transcriptional regulator of adaptative response/methylated-DNA-[protein]-cysteine methyltransferase